MFWTLYKELVQRHSHLQGGFCLLANIKRIGADKPFEVAPDVIIRPAGPDEVLTLSTLVAHNVRPAAPFLRYRNPYETRLEHTIITPTTTQTKVHPLQEGEHHYCVAEYTKSNLAVQRAIEASVVSSCEIQLGITVDLRAGLMWDLSFPNFLEEASGDDERLVTLELEQLEDLKLVIEKFGQVPEGSGLLPAIRQFEEVRTIPRRSPLRFLAYVAILESLLTHAPDPKDPYDSLTRQVRQKMLLLSRRFRQQLPYGRCFGADVDPGKVWTKLYSYRSRVAHGAPLDFEREFKILGSADKALEFIKAATASVMRQVLDEPELLSDLRAC